MHIRLNQRWEESLRMMYQLFSVLTKGCNYRVTSGQISKMTSSSQFSSLQSLSHVPLFATPWTAALQTSLSITNSWSLLKFMSIDLVMPSNHLILCRPLLLPCSVFPRIRVFSNESVRPIRWPKYGEFQLQHQSFQWIFRTDFIYNWLVESPCCPRDSQESSTPPFKSVNSSVLSYLYSPTPTCIHAYWENHSFD